MKPKHLYHGSIKKIKGDYFIPKKPHDLEKNPDNLHTGVYATNVKEIAIAMSIISCKGVYWASLSFRKKPYGIIYKGWPKQKYIFLYTLPSKTFRKSGGHGKQYVSVKPVKPLSVQKLFVQDYISLVRKGTKGEIKKKLKKYGPSFLNKVKL
jgi:hypothetical protein